MRAAGDTSWKAVGGWGATFWVYLLQTNFWHLAGPCYKCLYFVHSDQVWLSKTAHSRPTHEQNCADCLVGGAPWAAHHQDICPAATWEVHWNLFYAAFCLNRELVEVKVKQKGSEDVTVSLFEGENGPQVTAIIKMLHVRVLEFWRQQFSLTRLGRRLEKQEM